MLLVGFATAAQQLMEFVVHDLNNQLTTIIMHSELLLADPLPSAEIRSAVRDINRAAGSIHRMGQNLLDLNLSEAGQLVLRPSELDLGSLLAGACQRCKDQVDIQHQSLVLEVEMLQQKLYADGELLTRLVENLLDNALRYAPVGSTIGVVARRLEAGSWVELRISDEGCGIASEHREQVFEKYAQLDNPEAGEARAGRGLGLTFCRMAVEAHGGRIFIEDNHPQGSVFCVQLPLRAVAS